jgi:peptidoglycan hydrolase-like protein with peptidoglycan-binding domain
MAEPMLKKGSTDPAVRDLQEALKALGYDPGPIDGTFGSATETAVKAFQQAKGITVDGVVGKVTWINIDEADQSEPVLNIGSTGLPVRRAQKALEKAGWKFRGTVVRVEADGFGIIKFDGPIGPSGNTVGVFSSSTSSMLPFRDLRPGVHVVGTAEVDERDVAAVTWVSVVPSSA